LLLGPGDAGKTTFLKQLNILHSEGITDTSKASFIIVLRENCLQSMQILLRCKHPKFSIPKELQTNSELVLNSTDLKSVVDSIEIISKTEWISEVFNDRGNYKIHIPCVSQYYWSNAKRFGEDDFMPTKEDVINARIKTSGIQTLDFTIEGFNFSVVDVGGQRSERRKWLHCFDNVTAIIFLTALDEYDMFLEEDDDLSRFDESLSLWSEVTGSQFFKPKTWILFLNKYDSLKKKIEKIPLNNHFDDISQEDGKNLDTCVEYLTKKYQEKYLGQSTLHTYTTCALDTDNCNKVFEAVRHGLIVSALHDFLSVNSE